MKADGNFTYSRQLQFAVTFPYAARQNKSKDNFTCACVCYVLHRELKLSELKVKSFNV